MILKAKYVFPVSSDPMSDSAVLVRDDKIVEVDKADDLIMHYPDEEVIDFGVAAITPGFINLHTRIERTYLRGCVADEPYASWFLHMITLVNRLDGGMRYSASLVGCLEALQSGVTTIDDIATTFSAAKAANKAGIRAVIHRQTQASEKDRVSWAINSAERDYYDWQEQVDAELIQIGLTPAALFEVHPQLITDITKLANKLNVPLTFRMAGSLEEYNFIKRGTSIFSVHAGNSQSRGYIEVPPWLPFGVSPVEYGKNWGAFEHDNVNIIHGIYVDDADIKTLKEYGVSLVSCPASEAQLGMGACPFPKYIRNEIPLGLGTDSPAATEASDMLIEMRTAMLLNRAIDVKNYVTSRDVLFWGTLGGARVLGMDDKIGSLDPGKLADIAVVDLSHTSQTLQLNPASALINSCTSANVVFTMIGGKVMYDHGTFNTDIDLDELHAYTKKARKRVEQMTSEMFK